MNNGFGIVEPCHLCMWKYHNLSSIDTSNFMKFMPKCLKQTFLFNWIYSLTETKNKKVNSRKAVYSAF